MRLYMIVQDFAHGAEFLKTLWGTAEYWTDCNLPDFVWVEPSNITSQLLEADVFVLAHID